MSVFFVEDDEGRRWDDEAVREFIRSKANARVYECPIRLFDMLTRRVITREEIAEQLIEAVTKHVSTPPTPKDHDSSSSEFVEDASAGRDEVSVDEIERASLPPKWEDLKATLDHNSSTSGLSVYRPRHIPDLMDQYGRFAILSHRWSKNELLFSDTSLLRRIRGRNALRTRKPEGYNKFTNFARVVKDHDPLCRYIWVDTACIDKTSSAELDESIRSMYTWYEDSCFCVVHLAQTRSSTTLADDAWFKRGWTLQELLAPRRIKFYTSHWSPLFPNTAFDIDRQPSLSDQTHPEIKQSIANAAGIDCKFIHTEFSPNPTLAPLVFSWVARRQTSRPEDIAYCLIGLLRIHLPIAYGEVSDSAIGRLQVACIQSSPSRGLFVWDDGSSRVNSMLARHPSAFTSPTCDIHCDTVPGFEDMDSSFTLTNAGLRIEMWLLPVRAPKVINENIHGSLFNPDDVQIQSVFSLPDDDQGTFEKGESVVGVLGFDSKGQLYAVILSKESGYWVRDNLFTPMRLPSKSDLERSGVKPQRVLIK